MSNAQTVSDLSQQCFDHIPRAKEQECPEGPQILTGLPEKHDSMPGRCLQETVGIEDCAAAAAQTVIQGSGLRVFVNPLLEPLCFDLVDTLPQVVATYRIAYSHDGKYIATGDDIGNAYVFDAANKRIVFQKGREVKALIPSPVCFTPDGQSFIFASGGLVQVSKAHRSNHQFEILTLHQKNRGV